MICIDFISNLGNQRNMFYFLLFLVSAEPLSLPETLELVSSQNPELQIARLGADKANLERLKSLSMFAPSIEAKASWLDFGEPLEVNLLGDATQDLDCSSFDAFGMGDLCASFSEPMLLREAKIYDGSVQAILPLSSLYSIYQGYQANRHLYEIKELETQQLQAEIEIQVIEIYLQALHLEKMKEFTENTTKRLKYNQRKVDSFVAQDLLHPLESQRLNKALAEISLAQIQAEQGLKLLLKQLQLLLGRPIEPIPLEKTPVANTNIDLSQAFQVQIALEQQKAATSGYKSSIGQLLPTVALMAATTAAQGQGTLTPTEQQYVGIAVQGKFNWGQKLISTRQAKLDLEMAGQGLQLQTQALELQEQALRVEWTIAKEQESIAQLQVQISEENLRLQQEKFEQQLITVSELLDAENDLLKAKLEQSQSQNNATLKLSKYQYSLSSHPIQFE